ncbi:MAG: hypothetical protein JWO50_483 [Candidatus Kaiserbacteria bacterium]|nr:hypothetical protein [Candidatus Kaiserbacteria bacterium]
MWRKEELSGIVPDTAGKDIEMIMNRRLLLGALLASAAFTGTAIAAPQKIHSLFVGIDRSCPICQAWWSQNELKIRAAYPGSKIVVEESRSYKSNPTLLVDGARVTRFG